VLPLLPSCTTSVRSKSRASSAVVCIPAPRANTTPHLPRVGLAYWHRDGRRGSWEAPTRLPGHRRQTLKRRWAGWPAPHGRVLWCRNKANEPHWQGHGATGSMPQRREVRELQQEGGPRPPLLPKKDCSFKARGVEGTAFSSLAIATGDACPRSMPSADRGGASRMRAGRGAAPSRRPGPCRRLLFKETIFGDQKRRAGCPSPSSFSACNRTPKECAVAGSSRG
jgi:hypothetical protein